MQKILATYLLVTGIGALLALAVPGLVILGFFLLIIPGLLLSLAPTAFLWGCIFAVSWWLFRTVLSDVAAIFPALAVTAGLLFAMPWPYQQAGQRLLDASILPDITPSAPIALKGDIRIDLANPRWDNQNPPVSGYVRAFACDNLCLALLFTPGVRSVTVNDSGPFTAEQHREGAGGFSTSARTYRLVPRAQCGDRAIKLDLEGRTGLFGKDLEENRAIQADWNLRLSTEYCVVAAPPIAAFDMTIREGRYQYPEKEEKRLGGWALGGSRPDVNYVEIRTRSDEVLLRRLISRVRVLAPPLSIWPSGGLDNFRFGWGRKELSNAKRYAEVDLLKLLEAHSVVAGRSPAADLLPQMRKRLQQAMADPALPPADPAFALIEAYFAGIAKGQPGEEDLALVTALIADGRITQYRGLYHLSKLPAAQHRQISAAIVRRLLAAPDALALKNSGFSEFLAKSPDGAFASLSEDERRLLAAADRRIAAGGLIVRLSDRGAEAVPLLTEIARHHGDALKEALASKENATDRSARIHANSSALEAARIGFCRLGPAAAAALPDLEAMIASGTVPPYSLNGHGGTDWNLTLVRLGKPLDTIRKPESMSGTEAQHRRNLQGRLDRFDPDRSCGRF